MADNRDPSTGFDRLREQAEALIRSRPSGSVPPAADMLDLIHELRIHQAELEIQNDELKRAQQELSELYQEFEDLYEFAPCGYVTLGPDGMITRINLTGAKLLNVTRKRIFPSAFSYYVAPGWEERLLEARRRAGVTGEVTSVEVPLKRESGDPCWVRVDVRADRDGAGEVTRWRLVLTDVTDIKEAVEKKEKAEAQVRQTGKMEAVGQLAGGIAHDFNNILAAIIGFTELALEEVEKGSPLEDYLQEVYLAGNRAKDLVMQILTFARQTKEELIPVRVDETVAESLKLIRSTLPSTVVIRQSLGSQSRINGNPSALQQVFINLCTNAAQAMEEDGGTLDITLADVEIDARDAMELSLPGPGSYVKITVSDTGPGIPPDVIDSIFEPYYTTREIGSGTGMGLAIAYGIVRKYGGRISVESRLKGKTVFTVLLPVIHSREPARPVVPDEDPRGTERILLVDDEAPIVKMCKQALERLGYTVTARTDSNEALALFKATPGAFDLVITDMTMPDLTGDRLAAELMKIRSDIPVILFTGYSRKISGERAADIGIRAFAYKPVVKADLARTVRKALDSEK